MAEGYYILGVSPDSPLGSIVQSYLSFITPLENKLEFETVGMNMKVIKDFILFQGAMEEIVKDRIRKGEDIDAILPPDILRKFYYFKGKKSFIEGKYFDAGRSFERALKYGNRDPKIFYFMGRSFLESKKIKHAENALKMAIEIDKNNPYFWLYLGDVYNLAGMQSKAVHVWETALSLNKKFAPAISRLEGKGVNVKFKILSEKIKNGLKKIFGDKGEKKEKEEEE